MSLITHAQDITWKNPNFRCKEILVKDTLLILDSLTIIPEQISIKNSNNEEINPRLYSFKPALNALVINPSLVYQDLKICYYLFPEKKEKKIYSKDTSLIVKINKPLKLYEITEKTIKKNEFFQNLTSSGTLIRGITFGNNQSASVQSSLDLELSGHLSKEVMIKAAISDHNIPIQADGYTQRLDEFDKIYIELSNNDSYIRAGHLDLVQDQDYFANFSSKITGIQIGTRLKHKSSFTDLYALGSLSRGEFNRMKFSGVEGNQGPYKLKGKQGELFIIVISGSEKVYMNGSLLKRGEDQDYTINYNTGELTFTPKTYISSNSRIVVEYIYNTTTYTRFLLYTGGRYESEKFSFSTHIFSEKDTKESNQDLTNAQKEVLSQAGNERDQMYVSNAIVTEYDPNKILYKKLNLGQEEIYQYSTDSSEELYALSFTYMGANKGNYKIVQLPVNGRVYEYVPPIDGILQGEYEPITKLIPPQKTQVISTHAEYRFNKGNIGVNVALSNHDENTFSSIGNDKNNGFASRLYMNKNIDKKDWKSNLNLSHAFIQKNFHILERINEVEFDRDFNISQEFNGINQNKLSLGWQNSLYEKWKINYSLNFLDEENYYTGYKNEILVGYTDENTKIITNTSYLHSTQQDSIKSNFIKHVTEINHRIGNVKAGIGYKGEFNNIKNNLLSKYTLSSFNWNELYSTFAIDSAKINTKLKLYARTDDSVRIGKLKNFTSSYGVILNNQLIKSQNQNLYLDIHYRKVHYSKALYKNRKDENYILGSIRWNKIFLKKGLLLNSAYELSSGQEAQREFKYIKVTDGKGIYKWTDYNGNGIEEIDEFEVAEFSDQAQYIRVYTDKINYLKSNNNKFIFNLQVFPSRFLHSNWWERITLQSSFQSISSYKKKNKTAELNPFSSKDLLTQTQNFTSNLSFNRISIHQWTGTFQFMENNTTQFIFTGKDKRNNINFQTLFNYKPWDLWILSLQNNFITDKSRSQLFATKRYTIETKALNPSITYEIQKNISLSALVKYQYKKNKLGNERLEWKQAGVEFHWNDEKRTALTGSFSYIKNELSGNNFSLVSSQMMEGLLSGKNKVWRAYLQRELSSVFTLNIIYDGRKSEDSQAVHTGSIQIKASF
ncbi:hypothetical protein Ga0061079_104122 [Apibacter mensalis]|uniref:Uncharacterized protein n=1 Tax=Apibacter mensalis TaxID=1586267 RepID=A0A0X3AP37_9FLAO|nr:hypothetical protein [Apibacter mensalis]CVK16003.1 hypothetical protein Ga0061079_104122 [Apibacter mensalis]